MMNRFDRYIASEIAKAFFLVMLALILLFGFLDLIQQLDDIGSGNYRFLDAALYELRMLAPRTLELLPYGALMGTTLALALLAQRSEVIAAQAAGISVARLAGAVLQVGLLVAVAALVLDELLVSPLHQEAVQRRSLALAKAEVTPADEGFWIFHNNRFIHINRVLHGRIPTDIDILELDETRRVRLYIHAKEADVADPGRWFLRDVLIKRLADGPPTTEQLPNLYWESYLSADQVGLLELPSRTLSPSQLHAYVRYLQETGQAATRYELTLWQKLSLPIAVAVMVLLALPAAFGTPRAVSVGRRIILALVAGILFRITSQVVANSGLIFALPPALTTLATPVVTALIALITLRRISA